VARQMRIQPAAVPYVAGISAAVRRPLPLRNRWLVPGVGFLQPADARQRDRGLADAAVRLFIGFVIGRCGGWL
jgi:hypothetical protein